MKGLPEGALPGATPPSYSVVFPTLGNFKFVCLVHADMTGVVHVRAPSDPLPHIQDDYDRQTMGEQVLLLGNASRLQGRGTPADGASDNGSGDRDPVSQLPPSECWIPGSGALHHLYIVSRRRLVALLNTPFLPTDSQSADFDPTIALFGAARNAHRS
jgi:hypothetical protein